MFSKSELMAKIIANVVYVDGSVQFLALFLIMGVFFTYTAVVASYSIFSLKIGGSSGFYVRQTDPVTFLNYAYYQAKLTYPLCYTTLTILVSEKAILRRTAFYMVRFEPNPTEYWKLGSSSDSRIQHPTIPSDSLPHFDVFVHV